MMKIVQLMALVCLLAACQGNPADANTSESAAAEAPTPAQTTKEKFTNFSGEVDARYVNAMTTVSDLIVNFVSSEGDTLPVTMAFDANARKVEIPDNFMVPIPGQEGAFMPNPNMSSAPYVIEYKFGNPTVVRIK